jgi:hypothetical protein
MKNTVIITSFPTQFHIHSSPSTLSHTTSIPPPLPNPVASLFSLPKTRFLKSHKPHNITSCNYTLSGNFIAKYIDQTFCECPVSSLRAQCWCNAQTGNWAPKNHSEHNCNHHSSQNSLLMETQSYKWWKQIPSSLGWLTEISSLHSYCKTFTSYTLFKLSLLLKYKLCFKFCRFTNKSLRYNCWGSQKRVDEKSSPKEYISVTY